MQTIVDAIPTPVIKKELSIRTKVVIFGLNSMLVGIAMGIWIAFGLITDDKDYYFGRVLGKEILTNYNLAFMFAWVLFALFFFFIPKVEK